MKSSNVYLGINNNFKTEFLFIRAKVKKVSTINDFLKYFF